MVRELWKGNEAIAEAHARRLAGLLWHRWLCAGLSVLLMI